MDDFFLRKLIASASRTEEERVVFTYPKGMNSPLSVLLSHFDRKIDIQMDFALVQGKDPEIFLLEVDSRYIVVVDTAYLGIVYGLVSTFHGYLPISDPNLYARTKLKLWIGLVHGLIPDEVLAESVKARVDRNISEFNQTASGIFMSFPSTAADIEMLEYDEFYLALWFFFVTHEIAHCVHRLNCRGKF